MHGEVRCLRHLICRIGGTGITLALRLEQCHDGGMGGAHAATREEDARSTASPELTWEGKAGRREGLEGEEPVSAIFLLQKYTHAVQEAS